MWVSCDVMFDMGVIPRKFKNIEEVKSVHFTCEGPTICDEAPQTCYGSQSRRNKNVQVDFTFFILRV